MKKFIVELTDEQYQALINRAEVQRSCDSCDDDDYFNPMEASGGNFDDCYEMGRDHADVDTAQEILALLGEPVN